MLAWSNVWAPENQNSQFQTANGSKARQGEGTFTLNSSKHCLLFLLVVRLRGGVTLRMDIQVWAKITPKAEDFKGKELLPVTPVHPCEQQPVGSASLHHHWRGVAWCRTCPASSLCPVAECQIQLGSCHCKGKEFMSLINAARMTPKKKRMTPLPQELEEELSVFLSLKFLWLKDLLLRVCPQLQSSLPVE